jgi:lysophospholipase L1-like esterase
MGRIVKIGLLNVCFLLLGIAVLEVVFGTWFSSDPLDHLNIQRGIEINVDATDLYPGGGAFMYRRNRWGFRGDDVRPAEIDAVAIGGSTTNQLYLAEESTWQTFMEERLRELGRPLKIANAGLDGHSTVGMLYSFEAWFPHIPGLKPAYFVAYVGINDALLADSAAIDRLAYRHRWRYVEAHSAFLRLGRTLVGLVHARVTRLRHSKVDWPTAKWTDKSNYPDNRSARPQAAPEAYQSRLIALVNAIRAFGSTAILITQARGDAIEQDGQLLGLQAEGEMNGLDHRRLLEEFNGITLSVCEGLAVLCIDAARDIAYSTADFYDPLHMTPQGARKLGRLIAERLSLMEKKPEQ